MKKIFFTIVLGLSLIMFCTGFSEIKNKLTNYKIEKTNPRGEIKPRYTKNKDKRRRRNLNKNQCECRNPNKGPGYGCGLGRGNGRYRD